jgi:hypothetical protein
MNDRDARLRSHAQNISHYQNILKTRLSEVELHFVEKRLSEERFKMAMLEFMSPSHGHSPRANERAAP